MARERLTLIREGYEAWAWRYESREVMGRSHTHAELELNLVWGGRAAYLVDGVRYEMLPGTLLWLHSAQDHLLLDADEAFGMWIAVFHPRLVRRVGRTGPRRQLTRDHPQGPFVCTLAETARRRLDGILADLDRAAAADPVYYNAGAAWLLTAAWDEFSRARQAPPSSAHPAVSAAARLLRRQADPPDLPALAEEAGLSPSHLSRLFRKQTGLSIVAFRQRVMIERFFAIHAEHPELTVTAAAFRAGFGSYAQFHRVFTQHVGAGPRDYFRGG